MENSNIKNLNDFHINKKWTFLNKIHIFLHSIALAAILYYRASFVFNNANINKYHIVIPFLPWLLISIAELMLALLWALRQPYYWRPITRVVFPENLPRDEELPGIDVFICTADPKKEPTLDVMNTVISAMSLDYPAQKLNVYLSDDAGLGLTLEGLKEAWVFATWWLPFCRRYNIKPPCPQAYFDEAGDERQSSGTFIRDKMLVQEKYENFKQRVRNKIDECELHGDANKSSGNHPALVQVIDRSNVGYDAASLNPEVVDMPFLVYVAREKRPSYPHHFKAGALNVLQRVSSILSNSPYILILDCDMYCNDSISARQAMCFYLDPKIFSSLGYIQYPQKFHNISDSDIYDSQFRRTWTVYFLGANGFHGPVLAGTNFYIQRKALYDLDVATGNDLSELRKLLGPSNELLQSLSRIDKPNPRNYRDSPVVSLQESHFLASCIFEKGTKWGKKVGFWYDTVVEDVLTCIHLHRKGWKSIYMNPERPQFLGSATTNFNEIFVQSVRWYSGFVDVVLSKHCPLFQRASKLKFVEKMISSYFYLEPFYFLPVLCFATIIPISFLYGIPLYPQVSDPFFLVFAFLVLSSWVKHLSEVVISGGSITTWINEQRIWIIKSLTCYLFGSLECAITRLGFREARFNPTNKAGTNDTTELYQMGKYDFRTSTVFLLPLVTVVSLNCLCLIGGVATLLIAPDSTTPLFGQIFLGFYGLVLSGPVIEGMLIRKDYGRVSLSTTYISACLSMIILVLIYFY